MLKGHNLFIQFLNTNPFRVEGSELIFVPDHAYDKLEPSPIPYDLPIQILMDEYGDVVWVARYCIILYHIEHALQRYTIIEGPQCAVRPRHSPTHLQLKYVFDPNTIFIPEDFLLLKAVLESWPNSQWTLNGHEFRVAVTLPTHTRDLHIRDTHVFD
jgi:hypothetical protein